MIEIGNGPSDGGGSTVDAYWLNATWVFTEPPPVGLAQYWDLVLFTGSDPTNAANHVHPMARLPIADRQYEITIAYPKGKTLPTINAAIRTVYPWATGPWVIATATVTPVAPTYPTTPGDNLIPNPTSEMGLAVQGYGAALMVNDVGNSYAGSWCRKLDTSATNNTALTDKVPCIYGDQFSFSTYGKVSSASAGIQLVLTFYNASGTVVGTANTGVGNPSSSATYAAMYVQGTVPSGAVYCQASVQASTTAAATFGYFDNLSLRRAVNFSHMNSDGGFRLVNAVKNTGSTTNDRAWYAGNCDPGTRGGAPNISCLTIKPQVWDTTLKALAADFALQPTAASDNLDGMRYAKVQLYAQSVAGTTATLTAVGAPFFVPLKDRLFANATDSNAANAVTSTGTYQNSGIANLPAMLVTTYNAFGASDTHCFYSPSGWAAGTALTDNGTSWPAGITGGTGGGTGGGSGGGGACPHQDVLVDLPGGGQKKASLLQPGDMLWTVDPDTGTVGQWPVLVVAIQAATGLYDLTLSGRPGLFLRFMQKHRFRTTGGWKEIQDLQPGDQIVGTVGGTVQSVATAPDGNVVQITVDQVHSYQTSGLLSSNIKPAP